MSNVSKSLKSLLVNRPKNESKNESKNKKKIVKHSNTLNTLNATSSNKISNKSDSSELSDSESSDMSITNIKLNDLIYPCKDEILKVMVILHPHQMNNDIYINLKKNLINKIENKCIKEGYVVKVYKLLEYVDGCIKPENFTGAAVYKVTYLAKVCYALRETIIVAKIKSFISNFAMAEFGSVIKIIFTKSERDINAKKMIIENDRSITHIATKKKLEIGDHVKIQIKSVKFYQNDTLINCMGYLEDIATSEEIVKYAYNEEQTTYEPEYSEQNTIYFNEDIDITEYNNQQSMEAANQVQENNQGNIAVNKSNYLSF
jgi:DNA-directed RNA polymerase subunit E'/Rpb7